MSDDQTKPTKATEICFRCTGIIAEDRPPIWVDTITGSSICARANGADLYHDPVDHASQLVSERNKFQTAYGGAIEAQADMLRKARREILTLKAKLKRAQEGQCDFCGEDIGDASCLKCVGKAEDRAEKAEAALLEMERQRDEQRKALSKLSRALGNPAIISDVSIEDGLVEFALAELSRLTAERDYLLSDVRKFIEQVAQQKARAEAAEQSLAQQRERAIGEAMIRVRDEITCRHCFDQTDEPIKAWQANQSIYFAVQEALTGERGGQRAATAPEGE